LGALKGVGILISVSSLNAGLAGRLHPKFPMSDLPYPMHECGIFGVFGHPNAAVLA